MSDNGRDPYRGIIDMVRQEAAGQIHSTFVIGKVLMATETSIRIQADGHELDEQDIFVNAGLIPNFQETAHITMPAEKIEMAGILTTPFSAIDVVAYSGYIECEESNYKVRFRLKAGDFVLLMPDESRQLYYLICKVVRYGTVSAD